VLLDLQCIAGHDAGAASYERTTSDNECKQLVNISPFARFFEDIHLKTLRALDVGC